jgi:hypothetical protein
MFTSPEIIEQTKKWIRDVVVGCNFCPFAAATLKKDSIRYEVESSEVAGVCLQAFLDATRRLDEAPEIETVFLIFPNSFQQFEDYLTLVDNAENLLIENGYEGIYQVASFHPLYLFDGSGEKDAANYTNRSIYPMLHLLREASIDQALELYPDPENIPGRNIAFARQKGLVYMKMLRDTCLQK